MGGINQTISAGLGGFLALFVLAVVLWLLMRNMSGRLRNVRFDEELEDERRAAEAEAEGVHARPSRRRIFLPVDPDKRPTFAPDGPATAYGEGARMPVEADAPRRTAARDGAAEAGSPVTPEDPRA
ncbi:hypothetical protein [Mobilicoccus pelagius]|uniref:Uncharacterized protein n=1 Tax=Mobilicoccus pelagius NBRC 104925 TaxID=1089455 RepID=H5USA9_9MICO|nr:hypothetical protein [Mobilicoccus pelagius]GAB48617.1 hypothetical protein MOPEL_078_00060 [Mobilicoccus pelagius NBRC 104925]